MECLRLALLGVGNVAMGDLVLTVAVAYAVIFAGMVIFTKVERTFMDTI